VEERHANHYKAQQASVLAAQPATV